MNSLNNVGRILNNTTELQNINRGEKKAAAGASFEELLRQYASKAAAKPQELTFSKHAKQRLEQRNIEIDFGLIEKISGAVKKAAEKSIKNALVLSEESAFIVSVGSNVVVTAMNSAEMRENVITNIDGTVIL